MSAKELHLIGRIDQVVRDFFELNPLKMELLSKDLMPLFIKKGIFKKDNRAGKPIREILRKLG